MIFRNFKEAHEYYKYPNTHRIGTIGNEKGVIRSYSNGEKGDYYKNQGKLVFYMIKNEKIKNMFKKNIKYKKKVRYFRKVSNIVIDMGLYKVIGFKENFVKLKK